MKALGALLAGLLMLAPPAGHAQTKPITGYARIHGLKMY